MGATRMTKKCDHAKISHLMWIQRNIADTCYDGLLQASVAERFNGKRWSGPVRTKSPRSHTLLRHSRTCSHAHTRRAHVPSTHLTCPHYRWAVQYRHRPCVTLWSAPALLGYPRRNGSTPVVWPPVRESGAQSASAVLLPVAPVCFCSIFFWAATVWSSPSVRCAAGPVVLVIRLGDSHSPLASDIGCLLLFLVVFCTPLCTHSVSWRTLTTRSFPILSARRARP